MNSPLILKITVSGQPQNWVTSHQAAVDMTSGRVAWSFGESGIVLLGGFNHHGKQSRLEIPAILATRSDTRRINEHVPLTRRNLFARDGYVCMYCGTHVGEKNLTIDHIQPTSKGGLHTWGNTISACAPCNQKKRNRTPEEAGMQLLGVPYKPNRFEYLCLRNRHILADQMDFLSKGFKHLVCA
jgi:5-methylcytosine-specific restriction endonuclease McrA